MKPASLCPILLVLSLLGACGTPDSDPVVIGGDTPTEPPDSGGGSGDLDKRLSGGDTTIFAVSSSAFETPAPNLEGERLDKHLDGDVAFENVFVTAPAPVNSGLGPIFNNSACIRCHPRDGRGRAPEPGGPFDSLFLRISSANDPLTGPYPVQGYGTQLQHRAVFGVAPEASVDVSYEESSVSFADGETIELRKPTFTISQPYYPMAGSLYTSPRIAPPVFGRGLLEAIPEATIESLADENDSDGDGISGRTNRVMDPISGETRLGRFGWKAGTDSVLMQAAAAYSQDMGVTSSLFPVESSHAQTQDDGLLDDAELDDDTLQAVAFYVQTLAVPARRDVDDSQVVRGETLFADAGCSGCHIPQLETGDFDDVPEVAHQTIFPYTDLLLHDMGDGLADGREEFLASGSEWRTPPLWGIGLTATVNGHTDLLHDGRARNLIEAILWHGGEAQASRDFVLNLSHDDRDALLAFLNSL
ncbi:MAG: di-heme oxidoredictase family protein [Woeseiaceae bacterium]